MSNFVVVYRFQHTTSGLYVEASLADLKERFNKLLDSGRITLTDEFTHNHYMHGKMQHTVREWLQKFD